MSLTSINVNNTLVTSVDSEPTAGSDNLVKSGGVANKLAELAGKVVSNKSYIVQSGTFVRIGEVKEGARIIFNIHEAQSFQAFTLRNDKDEIIFLATKPGVYYYEVKSDIKSALLRALNGNVEVEMSVLANNSMSDFYQEKPLNAIVVHDGEESTIDATNKVYIVQGNLVFDNFTMPSDCVLYFYGGSISGSIDGSNTKVCGITKKILNKNLVLGGTWDCQEISTDMLISPNEVNSIKILFDLCNNDVYNHVTIGVGDWYLKSSYSYDPAKGASEQVFTDEEIAVQASGIIKLRSNTDVEILGSVNLLANNTARYAIFGIGKIYPLYGGYYDPVYIDYKDFTINVKIYGSGKIVGNCSKEVYAIKHMTGGAFAHAIMIALAKNVVIDGIEISDAIGDAVSLWNGSQNVEITNCNLHNCQRQGVSVVDGRQIRIADNKISHIGGTAPSAGVDLESNFNSYLQGIVVDNNRINHCGNGIIAIQIKSKEPYINDDYDDIRGLHSNIVISNNKITNLDSSTGDQVGVAISNISNIEVSNNTIVNYHYKGINLQDEIIGSVVEVQAPYNWLRKSNNVLIKNNYIEQNVYPVFNDFVKSNCRQEIATVHSEEYPLYEPDYSYNDVSCAVLFLNSVANATLEGNWIKTYDYSRAFLIKGRVNICKNYIFSKRLLKQMQVPVSNVIFEGNTISSNEPNQKLIESSALLYSLVSANNFISKMPLTIGTNSHVVNDISDNRNLADINKAPYRNDNDKTPKVNSNGVISYHFNTPQTIWALFSTDATVAKKSFACRITTRNFVDGYKLQYWFINYDVQTTEIKRTSTEIAGDGIHIIPASRVGTGTYNLGLNIKAEQMNADADITIEFVPSEYDIFVN